ncbi:UDP-N-acetylglucosamine 2-epimerase [Thalassobacillus sp. C254]|uniref:UDP-N-acetylglucosamine 2-epimerase n=1 Tax=Thalassobacillus sp. C254 TaxID=1225341 RepID=UPI0022B6617A|nr:UDP-N-acetylglucosamine 2-epimerase [Thalassobacillus sp. C254]
MHVLEEYGVTINEVRKDPFYILSTPSILVKGDTRGAMSKATGLASLYFADIIEQAEPDAVLILGDRGEMIAAAMTAHYQNVMIIHLHGGEKSGSADDAVRHAISKLSTYHLYLLCSPNNDYFLWGNKKPTFLSLGLCESMTFKK